MHEADLEDERYYAPEAPALDMALRGLSMTRGDDDILRITGSVFDESYEYCKRAILLPANPDDLQPLQPGPALTPAGRSGASR